MNAKKKGLLHFFTKTIIITVIIVSTVITVTGLVFAVYIEKNIEKTIDENIFSPVGTGESTKIYYYEYSDRENRVGTLHTISDNELYNAYKCKSVSYDQIPQDMINAFISIEDKRFLQHNGVDWKRTLSAGINYFLKFNNSFGGSTITQQLIKNVTKNDDYSFQRKIQEIYWALDLEKKMDKKEILQIYLNIINLSGGCFGVGAAAEYYFSKDIAELSLVECAAIAAITNSPTYYDPIRNPQNNKYRRDLILKEMLEQGYISVDEYNSSANTELILNVDEGSNMQNINSWYVDMVLDDVINDLVEKNGYSRSMASLMVYTGGLKIYTVMDPKIQSALDEYYANEKNFYSTTQADNPQSSIIVIDPNTGDVLGVAGSIGVKSANRIQNFATQTLRPAGSVIKPLSVYAPSLEKGIINWSSVYDDVPIKFESISSGVSSSTNNYNIWPKNATGVYRGLTDINYAISHSVNTVTVRVLEDLGLDDSFDFLYNDLNMLSLISSEKLDNGNVITDKDYAALALGQFNYGVTLRETTAAYSIFANNGVYNNTRSYLKVVDGTDKIILNNSYSGKAVISEENAFLMTQMLKNVVSYGTASDIKLKNEIDIAGKTGTTQNNYDKWFIGYSPYYICGVWMGYEYPKSLAGYSGKSCNRIWDEVMTIIHSEYISSGDVRRFENNKNVIEAEYCADSGKLLTEACKADIRGDRTTKGYFKKGTQPSEFCDTHVLLDYDMLCNALATLDCPKENVIQVGLINITRVFPTQVYISDAEYVWRDIGKTVLPETSPSLPFFSNILKDGEYSGISKSSIQANCYCREHFNYYKWKEEKEKTEGR